MLEDINLEILPGQMVALVGENGSGKTTLIKLLCRLYDPVSGNITIDGIDLRQFDPGAIRREFSVILQNYARYCLTARENIWLGDISLPAHDDKILRAARQTRASHQFQKLPRGYETILGHEFEDQGELSQGEWQKVALARAFLRQAQLVILDEPTSWMDARAEYEVFQSFRKMFQDRMVLLISHRFSTVRLADYIYVLEGGKIIEGGTHDDLMRRGGKYAQLFEMHQDINHEKPSSYSVSISDGPQEGLGGHVVAVRYGSRARDQTLYASDWALITTMGHIERLFLSSSIKLLSKGRKIYYS